MNLKKLRRFLQFHDWLWSVSLAFAVYLFMNYGPPQVFNVPMAYFAINWQQPLLATAGVMAGLYSIARLGLYFNLRKLHRYIYGQKDAEGNYQNFSKSDFNTLSPWQRFLLVSFWLLVFLAIALIVFLRFIPLSAPA